MVMHFTQTTALGPLDSNSHRRLMWIAPLHAAANGDLIALSPCIHKKSKKHFMPISSHNGSLWMFGQPEQGHSKCHSMLD